jgi:hypothetical protein
MRRAGVLAAVLALGSAVLLSGCVYLRLLEIKKQLKDFDKNFAVSGETELVIECKNPVMLDKDMSYLIGARPLEKTLENESTVWWEYRFTRVRHSDSGEAAGPLDELRLALRMDHGRMRAVAVPENFLLLFSRTVLLETLRSAADAQVLETRKMARSRTRLTPAAQAELPNLEKARALLGRPLEEKDKRGLKTLYYRYRIVRARRDVPIRAWLTFSDDGLLQRVMVKWDTASVDVNFVRT